MKVGAYVIEGANPRHEHEWRVWESAKLPQGRVLIPGVISHATNVVEHPELVAERIVRLARLVGRENRHRRHRLRLRPGPVPPPRASERSCGRSSKRWSKARGSPARNCGHKYGARAGGGLDPTGL